MNTLKSKLGKQSGFTLVEMLIVVAIIAILIAIAIPTVNTSLERAREATDAANERAAIGLASIEYLSDKKGADNDSGIGYDGGTGYYVVTNGRGSLTKDAPTAGSDNFSYGKGTSKGDVDTVCAGKGIKVEVAPDGGITVSWP